MGYITFSEILYEIINEYQTIKYMQKDYNFTFVIGAQKAGTTTIHELLRAHSDISLPSIKETHFFSHDKVYS